MHTHTHTHTMGIVLWNNFGGKFCAEIAHTINLSLHPCFSLATIAASSLVIKCDLNYDNIFMYGPSSEKKWRRYQQPQQLSNGAGAGGTVGLLGGNETQDMVTEYSTNRLNFKLKCKFVSYFRLRLRK